ncbi:hypothetical protein C8Q80DRAFT_1218365 [Daedaleopsis nitida]|nr:hypothetical protein C8Q80DRAFT_1218365 [Daedaleopsis nitida]
MSGTDCSSCLLESALQAGSNFCFSRAEALGLTLAWFRSAADEYELSLIYAQSQSAISEIVNWVVAHVDDHWSHLLDFDHSGLLAPHNLKRYADAIHHRGSPLCSLWGFIDCTICIICRRRNDNHLLSVSSILEKCKRWVMYYSKHDPDEVHHLQIFGDPAYGLSQQLISPFMDPQKHGFGIVTNLFPFLDANWKMGLFRSPVGHYYCVRVLLTNTHNCMYPNQVSQYFDCQPSLIPTMFEFF